MSIPSLLTVKQFAAAHPAFPEGGIRHLIFFADSNGLKRSGAILKIGKKILIDEKAFFSWLAERDSFRA